MAVLCVKGACAASLKKVNRWLFVLLIKSSNEIEYVYCQCLIGTIGTCSHTFALVKLIAKWVVD